MNPFVPLVWNFPFPRACLFYLLEKFSLFRAGWFFHFPKNLPSVLMFLENSIPGAPLRSTEDILGVSGGASVNRFNFYHCCQNSFKAIRSIRCYDPRLEKAACLLRRFGEIIKTTIQVNLCGKRPFAGKERKECSNETKFIISERRIIMTKGLFKTKPLMILALALVMVFCLSFGAFAAEYPASYV